MKKILFILQTYPAVDSANVRCDEQIIRRLRATGEYDIHVYSYEHWGRPATEIVDGVRVYRLTIGPLFRLRTWAKEHRGTKRATGIFRLYRLITRCKQALFIPIYPFYEPLLAKKYAKAVKRLHQKEQFDMVISEHYGLDTLYAGYALKKAAPDIKFLALLWDPFTGKKTAGYLPKSYAEKKLSAAEQKLLGIADAVVSMEASREYHLAHSTKKPFYDRMRYFTLPRIVPPVFEDGQDEYTDGDKINIVFAGILDLDMRDPEYIVRVLRQSKHTKEFRLLFFAVGSGMAKLQKMSDEVEFDIVLHNYIPQTELNRVYHNADILLNIGNAVENAVPSKVFEYLSFGKPILSTYHLEADTSKAYYDRFSLALLLDERQPVEVSAEKLDAFLEQNLGRTVPFDDIERQFATATPKVYTDLIKEVLKS